ncbi:unnamed protein product [Linum tenue]|uniref:Uncharacterized protein n=1 Tax=Linum tenue TaxID=586396 RepID=A0AAV0RZ51_9ROSI|nr:unnamed protein product [Linum tenue]CAI0626464.1 unnamed protein product [Linum tenue]
MSMWSSHKYVIVLRSGVFVEGSKQRVVVQGKVGREGKGRKEATKVVQSKEVNDESGNPIWKKQVRAGRISSAARSPREIEF